ncbi:MAG: hypothetical protein VX768_21775 [Planctomycetota bacterium]|nr:hypothetical protein [Planctomycetota bacterium]
MIRKLIQNGILLSGVVLGGWYFFHRSEIQSFNDAMVLLRQDGEYLFSSLQNASSRSGRVEKETIRIASFDLHDFNDSKLETTKTAETLVDILNRFDLVAIQGIQSPDHDALPRLMDRLRQVDPDFDYVIGPRSSHTALNHQFAFVYNRRCIELERAQVYTVQDPDDVVAHDPLVGWFRARGPYENAFTFSLVNLRVDETNRKSEMACLQKIKLAVKSDGHQEDDIILVGNFQENSISMHNQKTLPGYDYVITQDTTDLVGERQNSNIAFPVQATSEFTGRTGVVDFLTEKNLSVDDARKVSTQLPVWGEFFTREGSVSGYVASISK